MCYNCCCVPWTDLIIFNIFILFFYRLLKKEELTQFDRIHIYDFFIICLFECNFVVYYVPTYITYTIKNKIITLCLVFPCSHRRGISVERCRPPAMNSLIACSSYKNRRTPWSQRTRRYRPSYGSLDMRFRGAKSVT